MFPSEYCETFKNTYFEEDMRTVASAPVLAVLVILLFVAEKQCVLNLAKRTTVHFIASNKQVRHKFVSSKKIFSSNNNIQYYQKEGH